MQQTHELTAIVREESSAEIATTFADLSREAKIAIIKWILEEDTRKERANA